jgi:hypothetical protein
LAQIALGFIEIVSAVPSKLKMYENAPPPFKKKKIKIKKPASLRDTFGYQI